MSDYFSELVDPQFRESLTAVEHELGDQMSLEELIEGRVVPRAEDDRSAQAERGEIPGTLPREVVEKLTERPPVGYGIGVLDADTEGTCLTGPFILRHLKPKTLEAIDRLETDDEEAPHAPHLYPLPPEKP